MILLIMMFACMLGDEQPVGHGGVADNGAPGALSAIAPDVVRYRRVDGNGLARHWVVSDGSLKVFLLRSDGSRDLYAQAEEANGVFVGKWRTRGNGLCADTKSWSFGVGRVLGDGLASVSIDADRLDTSTCAAKPESDLLQYQLERVE